MTHPVLPEDPTLSELQTYITAMLKFRNLHGNDPHKEMLQLVEELGEFARAIRKSTGGKFAADTAQANLAHEAADVCILFVSLCNILQIDLAEALHDKEEINKQRVWK